MVFLPLREKAVEAFRGPVHPASMQGSCVGGILLECVTSIYLLGDWEYCAMIEFFTFKIISSVYRADGLIMPP